MARSKEGRPEEFYKAIIRSLKKENNQLRKQVKHLQGFEKAEKEKKAKEPIENLCLECGKGTLIETEFAGRIFEICNLCKDRKKRVQKKKRR